MVSITVSLHDNNQSYDEKLLLSKKIKLKLGFTASDMTANIIQKYNDNVCASL